MSTEPENDAHESTATKTARAWEALLEADAEGRTLGEALEIPPGVIGRAEMVGYRLYRQGDYERAKTIATGIIALDEDRMYPHLLLGDILLKQMRQASEQGRNTEEQRDSTRDARRSLECVLELDPAHAPAKVKLARLHIRLGEWRAAETLLSDVLDAATDDAIRAEADVLREVAATSLGSLERDDH